jgi:hypothetical protein
VQEAVLVEPDVDERRFQAGQNVVHPALVDVSDYGARSPALYVELTDAPLGLGLTFGVGGSLRLQNCHTGFATVDRDEHLLSQEVSS